MATASKYDFSFTSNIVDPNSRVPRPKQPVQNDIMIPPEEEPSNCSKCIWVLCCCPYYSLCCCFCWKQTEFRNRRPHFVVNFQKWMPNLPMMKSKHEKNDEANVTQTLIKLYSGDHCALQELAECRVNPDLKSPVRNDLEFYIPQLCSYYLTGFCFDQGQLTQFILQASQASFFFSHRIWFFMQAVIWDKVDKHKADQQKMLVQLVAKSLCSNVVDSNERMFLNNSHDLMRLLVGQKLAEFYPQLENTQEVKAIMRSFVQKQMLLYEDSALREWRTKRFDIVKRIVDSYTDYGFVKIDHSLAIQVKQLEEIEGKNNLLPKTDRKSLDKPKSNDTIETQEAKFKVRASDIILAPFSSANQKVFYSGENNKLNEMILKSYLSTPVFIQMLTDLSFDLIAQPQKGTYLKQQLKEINRMLPASVYIPFVNSSMRNYAVLHIVAEESRIFQTKERAPLMLCIEVYRPEELSLEEGAEYHLQKRKDKGKKDEQQQFLDLEDLHQLKASTHSANDILPKRTQSLGSNAPSNNFPFGSSESSHNQNESGQISQNVKGQPSILIEDEENKVQNEKQLLIPQEPQTMMKKQVSETQQNSKKKKQMLENEFKKVKNIEDQTRQSEAFGKFIDDRASNPLLIKQSQQPKDTAFLDKISFQEDYFNGEQQRAQTFMVNPSVPISRNGTTELHTVHERTEIEHDGTSASAISNNQRNNQDQPEREESMRDPSILNYINTADPNNEIEEGAEDNKLLKMPSEGRPTSKSVRSQSAHEGLLMTYKEKEKERQEQKEREKEIEMIEEVKDGELDEKRVEKMFDTYRASGIGYEGPRISRIDGGSFNIFSANKRNSSVDNNDVDFYQDRSVNNIFMETSKEQDERVRKNSPFGNLKTWKLLKMIVKSNDDVRQEQFAMQLISQIQQIFKQSKLDLWLKPYEIIATGPSCGLIEVATDALSIHSIKEKTGQGSMLVDYFRRQFGEPNTKKFKRARSNFCHSLAAYSLVCYILQIKDRHNGNILVDIEGHVFHIDFGFLISNAPGKGLQFESAPFKLTVEYMEVLGRDKQREFRSLMRKGFMALQEHGQKLIVLVEMMLMGQSDLPCFQGGRQAIADLKKRLYPQNKRRLTDMEAQRFVDGLIRDSYNNWRTRCYDRFQLCAQGIL